MQDPFPGGGPGDPARQGFSITPDDDADLDTLTRALYVGNGGTVVVILADNKVAVTLENVPDGACLPIRAKRVMEATTATALVGLV